MNENDRDDMLALMRRATDDGYPLSTGQRLQLQHANAQCLRTLNRIAGEGGE